MCEKSCFVYFKTAFFLRLSYSSGIKRSIDTKHVNVFKNSQLTVFRVVWRCLVIGQVFALHVVFLQSGVVADVVSVLETVLSLVVDRGVR